MKSVKYSGKKIFLLDLLFVSVMILYPLRHIHMGLDLWDTGYNYANFTYMGTEHMDPMWLFSTYLATAAGHLLTMFPGAGGLLGMNFYTGLFAGGLGVGGYFFCVRKLGISRMTAFVGEMAALSLCWCPTAVLYNYITYVFILICVILLYKGLSEERIWCLIAAGICLGCNILVRFSNLPEMGLITAVWAWDFILWREGRKTGKKDSLLRLALRHTLWCLAGYLAALGALFGYIHIRYGMDAYVKGIARLFAMTENAADYKAKAMLMKLFGAYVENLYWAARFGVIILAGMAGFALLSFVRKRTGRREKVWAGLWRLAQAGWCVVSLLMLAWLYRNNFFSFSYYSYDSILRPAVLFLMLAMLIGVIRIFHPGSTKEERLIAGLVILMVIITSIGSNNGVFPSINNLFVAAPYTLWECRRFAGHVKAGSAFAVKGVLASFLALFLFQSAIFGACFVFEESTGARNITCDIENNAVLKNIKMSPDRAIWLEELSAYVEERGLRGREAIFYGWIPSLSYYLQMPSAFNPWSDLDSYGKEVMADALNRVAADMESGRRERPVIMIERDFALYLECSGEAPAAGAHTGKAEKQREKSKLLQDFMNKFNYDLTYQNEKFCVYE